MSICYYVSTKEASYFLKNKMGVGNTKPTTGLHRIGDFIVSNTQEDNIFGWVCIEEGEPGTWVELGYGNNTINSNIKTISIKSTTTISFPTNEVNIGISSFDKNNDTLMVYKNSTFMIEGVDYDINTTGSKIISKNGNWNQESLSDYRFAFIVLKSVEVGEDENTGSPIDPVILDKINSIGDITQLQTENKTDLVNAINELKNKSNDVDLSDYVLKSEFEVVKVVSENNKINIGLMNNLQTASKTDLVSAINEINENIDNIDLSDYTLKSEFNTVESNIGILDNLQTDSKTDLVSAINEIKNSMSDNNSLIEQINTILIEEYNEYIGM